MSIVAILLFPCTAAVLPATLIRPMGRGQECPRHTLSFLRRSLRRLQRIYRSRTRKSSTLSRRLLRLADNQVPALRPRHAAFHHQKILFLVDTQHAQITLRYPRVAHMSRHAHSFEHARRKRRRANRSSDLEHRSVRLGTAAEVMPLHDALEAFSLAHAHDVDELFAFKNLHQHAVANLPRSLAVAIALKPHFAHELHRRKIILRQVSACRLGEPRLFHELDQANLSRFVSVLHRQLMLRHHTRTSLQHCHRAHVALRVKQLRHADLLAQNACNFDRHLRLHPAWLVTTTTIGWHCAAGASLRRTAEGGCP